MTDESAGTEPKAADPATDRPGRILILEEFAEAGQAHLSLTLSESVALAAALGIFSKAFLETLGKHAGDGIADLLRTRVNRTGREAQIGLEGDAAATVVVTEDLPDEARLALLDLDVTADELRGKLLRWDGTASAWRPADDK